MPGREGRRMTAATLSAERVVRAPGSRRRLLAAAAVALLAVEAILVGPTLTGAVTSLFAARPGWVVVAVLAAAGSMSMFSRSRRRLLRAAGVHVPARSALAAVYVANAIHVTIPGGAAFSTAYTFRWMRRWGASGPAATWTLAGGGVVASAALAALGLVGSLLVGGSLSPAELAPAVVSVLLVVVTVRALQRRPERALVVGRWVLGRVNALRRRPPSTGAAALDELVAQLRSVRPTGRDWLVSSAFALANWAFDMACLGAGAVALGVHGLTVPLLLVAYTAGMVASSVSLLPGGIGVVDAALVLTLVAGGVPTSSALPAVLLYRLISLVGVVAVGWVVAAVQARRPRGAESPQATGLSGRHGQPLLEESGDLGAGSIRGVTGPLGVRTREHRVLALPDPGRIAGPGVQRDGAPAGTERLAERREPVLR
ncbi:MAG: hypothetical protein JWP40_4257 [Blastococcus sp.]|nr:hypothetical protein [Blastococcus sp.]